MAEPVIKPGAIDLNLLVVFDAVMQERSVTRAGARLGLSQPAMSHALGRLRHMLKDDLFIRGPRGMVPTPRADELASPVRAALDELMRSLEPTQFDPATTQAHFRIAVDNYAAIVLVPPLAGRAGKSAPVVTLEFRPSGTLNIADLFDRGELDLAIGSDSVAGERFSHMQLLQDEFVIIGRKNHTVTNQSAALSIGRIADLDYLEISSIHHSTDFVDASLARRRLKRRISLSAPFLSAGRILETTDMVSVLPKRIAQEMVHQRSLSMRPLSFASPTIATTMVWARRHDHQPAHRWLRELVKLAAADLSGG